MFLNINALIGQAIQNFQGGKFKEAKANLINILNIQPNNTTALELLGITYASIGEHKNALECFVKITKIKPDSAVAWSNRGNALKELKQYDQAIASYDKAINLNPNYEKAWSNRGNALKDLKQYEQALASYDKAIHLKPDYPEAWSNRGVTLQELNLYDEALASYNQAINFRHGYAEAWSNRSVTLKELKQYDQALSSCDKAISLKPDYPEAWSNRGIILQELRQYDKALISYNKAINLKPDYADAYWNKSLAQLLTSDFSEGWANYEYRWLRKNAEMKSHQTLPNLVSINDIESTTILVWSEQGYGDTLQFSRYVPLLASLGADVVFEVQAPLKSLIQESFPSIKIITRDEIVSGIDYQVPLMSLPRLFSTDLSKLPYLENYLKPSPDNLDQWKAKLNLNSSRANIGIACSGSEAHINDKNRSMALHFFEPLAKVANLFLIQKDLRENDKDFLSHHPEIVFFGSQISTFEDTASIVQQMDLIVTVDTSLIHLSGAMGKASKLLVPWNPEWRWLLDRSDSPWYPSVKIFRQPNAGDWESVIQDVISNMKSVA